MCRLLFVKSNSPLNISSLLEPFAAVCRGSREYQGHGWGMAYEQDRLRHIYHHLNPIWDDQFQQFGSTRFLVAHARSAFRDEGIIIQNNMPFVDDQYAFIFNGELRGVKVKAEGRIGAEKIFHVVKRFNRGDMLQALQRAVPFLERSSVSIRAMNMIITDMEHAYICSYFTQDPDYFTMYQKHTNGLTIVCSQPFPGETGWEAIPCKTIKVL